MTEGIIIFLKVQSIVHCNLRLLVSVPCKCSICHFYLCRLSLVQSPFYIMHVLYWFFHSPFNRHRSVLIVCPRTPWLYGQYDKTYKTDKKF